MAELFQRLTLTPINLKSSFTYILDAKKNGRSEKIVFYFVFKK